MKKIISILVVGLILFSSVACSDKITIDKDKTQLYVYSYNGGIGNQWLLEDIKGFEEMYKDVSFEEGKTGVQIIPDITQKVNGRAMVDTIAASSYEVIFNEYVYYNEWVSKGLLLDISDILNEENTDSKTIASKLSAHQLEMLSIDGKVYALPHYEAFRGVIYDVDLFEEEKLYFAKDRTYGDFILQSGDARSAGPDGIYDTADDGLPATYEEFFELCDYMANEKNITPFIWAGEQSSYTLFLAYALYETMAGADEAMLDYSFGVGAEGDAAYANIVRSFQNGQPVVEKVKISESNGYELKQTEAKYRALEFLFKIFNTDKYFYRDSMGNATMSNRVAQESYIFSKLENKPVAMLIDGSFWEAEAQDSFSLSEMSFGDKAKNRNFARMALPGVYSGEVNEENGKKQVLNNYINAYCGINANIKPEKIELAKKFVQYCYSDAGLNQFTKSTGMTIGVDYELSADTLSAMSGYSKNLYDLRRESDVITMQSKSNLFISNEQTLGEYSNFWISGNYTYPINAFKAGQKSAEEYFKGMAISQERWESLYGSFFQ